MAAEYTSQPSSYELYRDMYAAFHRFNASVGQLGARYAQLGED